MFVILPTNNSSFQLKICMIAPPRVQDKGTKEVNQYAKQKLKSIGSSWCKTSD